MGGRAGYPYRVELTPRKQAILRSVVEEFVATGQPVGSKWIVERSELDVSSSTVRGELAELEGLGLLTHPHTSAGRVPTESGYRFYAETLVDALEGRPGPFSVDLSTMRNELEEALRQTTEALSEATHLLAVVSAPSWTREVVENLDVLRSPTMDDVDRARLLARGAAIREESLDFGRHVRRFPVAPEELLDRELAAAAVDPGS